MITTQRSLWLRLLLLLLLRVTGWMAVDFVLWWWWHWMAGLLADWRDGCWDGMLYQVLPQLSFLSFSDKFNLLACFKQKRRFYSLALQGQSEKERESSHKHGQWQGHSSVSFSRPFHPSFCCPQNVSLWISEWFDSKFNTKLFPSVIRSVGGKVQFLSFKSQYKVEKEKKKKRKKQRGSKLLHNNANVKLTRKKQNLNKKKKKSC